MTLFCHNGNVMPFTTHKYITRRHRQKLSGFTLMEVVLAMTVFMMMALLYGAAVPVALRGTQQGENYTQAALIAQHKIDQLRSLNFATLGSGSLLYSDNIIDSATTNSDGSYSFTNTDHLVTAGTVQGYFPAGTTGTVLIQTDTSTMTMQSGVYDVTVTITWPKSTSHSGSYTLKNKIINY